MDGVLRAALLLPALVVALTSLVFAETCHRLLTDAAAGGGDANSWTLMLVIGGFVLASAVLVVVQAGRVAHRLTGPELRLVESLRRIRQGDLSFHVHLRRGDPLVNVARECNALLDWLNVNPPPGSRTGGDIVEVEPAIDGEGTP